MIKKLLLLALLICQPLWATTYYVDNCVVVGNDGNSGTDTAHPWLTIAKVNGFTFAAGDSVLFERTCTWREQLTVPLSGTSGHVVTFGAYGTGAKPIIDGSALITSGWSQTSGWQTEASYTLDTDDTTGTHQNVRSAIAANIGAFDGTKVRVTLSANTANDTTITGCSIGASTTAQNFDATPTRITFSGSDGVTITKNTTLLSDEITFSYDHTKRYLLQVYSLLAFQMRYSNSYSYAYTDWSTWSDLTLSTSMTADQSRSGQMDNLSKLEVYSALSNIWQIALTTEPYDVAFNGTLGTRVASVALVNGAGKWYWSANVLYVYSTSDPGTAYTSPGIEPYIRSQAILISDKSYITIDGLDLTKTKSSTLYATRTTGAPVGLTITNCTVHNNSLHTSTNSGGTDWALGIKLDGIGTVTISRNEVYETDWTGIGILNAQTPGADISTIAVLENDVHNTHHNGIDSKAYTGNITGLTVSKNRTYGCTGNGLYLEANSDMAVSNSTFSYNLSYLNELSGFDSYKASGTTYASGILFYNNVLYANGQTAWGLGIDGQIQGSTFRNNIIFGNNVHGDSAKEIMVNDYGGTANTFDYNLIAKTGQTDIIGWNGATTTFLGFQGTYGQEAHGLSVDPLFVNAAGGDFRLSGTSPAINAGTNLGATYQLGLDNIGSFPWTLVNQSLYGDWEIGAFVYPVRVSISE